MDCSGGDGAETVAMLGWPIVLMELVHGVVGIGVMALNMRVLRRC